MPIDRDQMKRLNGCSGDEHAIKRIGVDWRQVSNGCGVLQPNRPLKQTSLINDAKWCVRLDVQLAECGFDRSFPD